MHCLALIVYGFFLNDVYKILVNVLLISWNVFLQILRTILASLGRYLQENEHFSCIRKVYTRFLEVLYKYCIQTCVSSLHDLAPSCKIYLEGRPILTALVHQIQIGEILSMIVLISN